MIIIGIDIGKNKHEATLIDEKGNIIGKSIKFENSTAGFNKLISSINNYNICILNGSNWSLLVSTIFKIS